MSSSIHIMARIVVILALSLAAICIIGAAIGVFTRFFRVTAGRLTLICLVVSICGALFMVLFLPGQRHLSSRLRHWYNRSTAYVLMNQADREFSETVRQEVTVRREAARKREELPRQASSSQRKESARDYPSPPPVRDAKSPEWIVIGQPPLPPEEPLPASDFSIRSFWPVHRSRLLAFLVSATLLAAFLFLGYLFLDGGTRGQFTWSLRITALIVFLSASAMLMWWRT